MTVTELLDALEATVRDCAPPNKPKRRQVVFTVRSTSPHLLGESGWRMPDEPAIEDDRPVYGFTLRQVERMRERLVAAVLEDAGLPA